VATDTFDPWTALGIAPNAGEEEARKAYKAIIRKYHPDLDPSPEASKKFQDAVRAQAVISGEDRKLDESTLLKNAVENMRNDVEFKRQQISQLKAQAAAEEASVKEMEKQNMELSASLHQVKAELDAVMEYFEKIKGKCIAKPETYEEAKKRREAEIAGCKEALSILEGEAALLQESTIRHTLRGSRVLRTHAA